MIKKSQAGYLHLSGTEYTCADCLFYQDKVQKCALIRDQETVVSFDSCNYFYKSNPSGLINIQPVLTAQETGFARSTAGFTCSRCEYFDMATWKCAVVDANSPGDDPSMIHPLACCNGWEADDIRGQLDRDTLTDLIAEAVEARLESTESDY